MSESSKVEDTIVVVEVLFELTETDAAQRHRLELKASAVRLRQAQPKSQPNGRTGVSESSGSAGTIAEPKIVSLNASVF